MTDAGGVKCWGANEAGQLGNGTLNNAAQPVDVSGLSSGVVAIAAGGYHTCALTSRGGVKCWGDNRYGQLGNGLTGDGNSPVPVDVPVDVVGLSNGVSAISAGLFHTCALTRGGGVKCWGGNPRGGIGDGTTTNRSVPVDVSGLASGVIAIAVGTLHTCAVTTGGAVTCWGFQQGRDLFDTSSPVPVAELARGVTAISASLDRTCALTESRGITCWGPNYGPEPGQVLPDRFVSIDVSGLAGNATMIATGETHACVLTSRGGVACWGTNYVGQLGNSTGTGSRVPREIAGLTSAVTAIAVGGFHSCALLDGGGVKCWGSNYAGPSSNFYGVLGGSTKCSSSSVPLDVAFAGTSASPSPGLPSGPVVHANGGTAVLLRLGYEARGFSASDLGGESFIAGPAFTLYGDGTVIFQDDSAQAPALKGPIVRAPPFRITHLDEARLQALLQFAIGEGGLAGACERYETQDLDAEPGPVLTIHTGGLDKRVAVDGPSPLGPLMDRLWPFDPGTEPTDIWTTDRHWGGLFDATDAIANGLLPPPAEAGSVAWPWPGIVPGDFVGQDEGGYIGTPRRRMSAAEAAVLGLSDKGGVVQRVYLVGPDGKTIYVFSLWPMLPDEPT